MIISEKILYLMKEKGMSQVDFSEKTGIAQSTISDWKRKKTNPSADKLAVICAVLEISPNQLLLDYNGEVNDPSENHITVMKGTDSYELLVEFDKLRRKEKERVLGYMEALKK